MAAINRDQNHNPHAAGSTPEVNVMLRKSAVVPADAIVVTVGVYERRLSIFRCVVLAHGPQDQHWLIDDHSARSLKELWDSIISRPWPHADGGDPLTASLCLIETACQPARIDRFCTGKRGVHRAVSDLSGALFKKVERGKLVVVRANPDYWGEDRANSLARCAAEIVLAESGWRYPLRKGTSRSPAGMRDIPREMIDAALAGRAVITDLSHVEFRADGTPCKASVTFYVPA